jgi:DNA-binding XRE family transcriptional regulator
MDDRGPRPVLRPVPEPAMPESAGEEDPLLRELVGARLRRVRLDQGRTLREVAENAQVSLPYLSEIERGRKEPSSEVLASVCRALHLRLADLLGTLHGELTAVPAVTRPAAPGRGGPQAMLLAA